MLGGGKLRTPIGASRGSPSGEGLFAMVLVSLLASSGCLENERRGSGLVVTFATEPPDAHHRVEFKNSVYTVRDYSGPGGTAWVNLNCEDPSQNGADSNWWMRITVYESDDQGSQGAMLDRQNFTGLLCPSSVLMKIDHTGHFTITPDDDDYDGHPLPTGRRF